MHTRKLFFSGLLSFAVFFTAFAQKKPLDHQVYDGWQQISMSAISKDGRFVYYIVNPQEGDGYLTITTPDNRTVGRIARAANPTITADGKFLIALIKPLYSQTRAAKIKKKKPEEMPKDSLAIFTLETAELLKIPRVRSFKTPAKAGGHVAYLSEPDLTSRDTLATDSVKSPKTRGKKGEVALHVRELSSGEEFEVTRVDNYLFSDNGKVLVYVRNAKEKDSIGTDAGLFYYDIASGENRHISRGKGIYSNITFDEDGTQLAFTADKSPEKALVKNFALYYYVPGQDTAAVLVHKTTSGIPNDWYVSGDGNVRFSQDGSKLFFGIAPIPPVRDTSLVEFEHAKVDIWHWKDDYLQTQQLVNLKRDQNRSYLAVIYPGRTRTVIPLADPELPDVRLTEDANQEFALGITDFGRRIQTQWMTGAFQDIYTISTINGQRKKIAGDIRGPISLSPSGNYILWYNRNDSSWYSHQINSGLTVKLNDDLPVLFADEDNDVPDEPNAYGIAGWTEDDNEVWIYDKYDIWAFQPDGSGRRLVTNGAGRSGQLTFRYRDLTAQNRNNVPGRGHPPVIDLKKDIILSAFNHGTKENGWYRLDNRRNRDPRPIVMGPYRYNQVSGDENGSLFIYTKENYVSPPDLHISPDFVKETQLSRINPQQQEYNWGTAELIRWTTPNGHAAEGILYKPEDFDPSKKYPVIAYFYETLSDGLYSYIPPAPTPSRLNISFFVSNGYLVFAPDIRYEIGYPGRSAEEFINSGMEELKKQPWVDGTRMGIQGQSWGGYQVAHLITRTDMYAAAWAGAPVVNMTSAYGGIRWESGMNRQFQYERTQSRIGATLWEKPELYIENSPLFHLPNVKTPVVIMANDQDGAVPWYQGIEMFTALRRLQKPVWLLNYNGEAHNLVQRQNRKDIQRRQLEFFDHFLKGKPAAPWISDGVPAVRKGIDWGFSN